VGPGHDARLLLTATALSVTGDGAFETATPLLAAALTRNPTLVAATAAAAYGSGLVFGLPGGALADRWPRRKLMVTADVTRAVILAAAAAVILSGHASILLIICAVVCVNAASCCFFPAAQAIIPAVAGDDEAALQKINGRFWAISVTGQGLTGPPAGSAMFVLNRAAPVLADCVSFAASAVLVRRLRGVGRDSREPAAADGPGRPGNAPALAGVRHVMASPQLRAIIAGSGLQNLAVCGTEAIFVLYAREVLGLPAWAFGPVMATAAVGAAVASWRAGSFTGRLQDGRLVAAAAILVQGLVLTAMAVAGTIWMAITAMGLIGGGAGLISVATGTACQRLTPDNLRGRVAAVVRVSAFGGAAAGALVGGLAASQLGLTGAVYLSAALSGASLLVVLPWQWLRHGGGRGRTAREFHTRPKSFGLPAPGSDGAAEA
jgi:MFS family permease